MCCGGVFCLHLAFRAQLVPGHPYTEGAVSGTQEKCGRHELSGCSPLSPHSERHCSSGIQCSEKGKQASQHAGEKEREREREIERERERTRGRDREDERWRTRQRETGGKCDSPVLFCSVSVRCTKIFMRTFFQTQLAPYQP